MLAYYAKLKDPIDHVEVYQKLLAREEANDLPWYSDKNTYSFKIIKVQDTYITDNPTLSVINDRFKMKPYIFKMPANTYYNWHTDADRGLSINLLLNNHEESFTCFTNENISILNSVHRMTYDPGHFYLFNSQVKHSVLNLNKERYFFSLTFDQDKSKVSYADVIDYCFAKDLIIQPKETVYINS